MEINGPTIGIVMKEAVRRAIVAIRNQRFLFEVETKMGYDGLSNDIVTLADKDAQSVYLRVFTECFPGFGIIAEENNLRMDCRLSEAFCFTVDPLDGTKAFSRRQSNGIGTMVALMHGEEVIAAFVGDIMTFEIYGYRPCSDKVHRISELEKAEQLMINPGRRLEDQYVDLRAMPHAFSRLIQGMVMPVEKGGLFKNASTSDGSIGISLAKLWKGEVGAAVLPIRHDTPWDLAPVVGISKKLGFTFFQIDPASCQMTPFEPKVPKGVEARDYEILIVHSSRTDEVLAWVRTWTNRIY